MTFGRWAFLAAAFSFVLYVLIVAGLLLLSQFDARVAPELAPAAPPREPCIPASTAYADGSVWHFCRRR
mgnify:CR=1 FL=1